MGGIGVNRDYKTHNKLITARLEWHQARMVELEGTGLDRDTASEKAFAEIKKIMAEDRKQARKFGLVI